MFDLIFFGIGNDHREDDGLGPYLLRRLEALYQQNIIGIGKHWQFIEAYQLQIEDALILGNTRLTMFIDAGQGLTSSYTLLPINAHAPLNVNTHQLTPAELMGVYERTHHQPAPSCWQMLISGQSFNLSTTISPTAISYADESLQALIHWIHQYQ